MFKNTEQYIVKFWILKDNGYWNQEQKIYRGNTKADHDNIKKQFQKDYPEAQIVSISYV